jgi:radical SAM superfamily enzyme YgiQ (UPF0313 family)
MRRGSMVVLRGGLSMNHWEDSIGGGVCVCKMKGEALNEASMGGNVLLVSVNQYDFPYPVFPLGLAQVEGALRRKGYRTRLVDWNVDEEPVEQVMGEFQADWVGVSLRNIDDALIQKRETFFDRLKGLCEEVRRSSPAPIVLGGSGFSIFPERLLELSGADYGIQGEGEQAFPRLMETVRDGGDLGRVPGLVYRREGSVRINAQSAPLAGAEIGAPSGVERLSRFYLERSSMMNIQTQRGCALRCCYCTYPLLEGRSYRRRPADAVVDELEYLEAQGARYVFFVDSVFNTAAEHVAGICEGILGRGLRVNWCCFLRPKGLTRELMRLMVRAGLRHIEYGSDSLCDSVLEECGKHLTFEDIRHSSELARLENVDYAHYLICGGPGETYATLQTSFDRSRTLSGATFMARVGMRVYPGTPLHARVLRERGTAPDLLEPSYYVSPEVSEQGVFDALKGVSREMPNWVFEDPPPTYFKMAERLRARGVVGPLWCYFSIMQRLGGAMGGTTGPVAVKP